MPRFYQDTKVSVAVTTHRFLYENGIKLFIHIPIYEVKYQFQLYKVYNLPIYNPNSTHGVIYGQLADYLAISTDKETYIHLDERELERCKKTPSLWNCPIIRPVSRTSATPSYLVSLLWNNKEKNDWCTQELVPWEGTYSIYIGDRKWLFSDQRDREVTYACSPSALNQRRVTRNRITKMSVLDVPKGCTIYSKNWILPPVFQKEDLNITTSTDIYELDFEETGSLIIPTPEEELEGDEHHPTATNGSTSQ